MGTRFWLWLQDRLGLDPRGLFVFFDGVRWRRVDPLQVARTLFAHPEFDWDETPQLLLTGRVAEQLEAFRLIGVAVRSAFQVRPIDQGGLSERECLDLLSDFRRYLGNVKKNGSLFPISPDCTEPPSAGESGTKPGWACGSTAAAPSCGPPGLPAEPTLTG